MATIREKMHDRVDTREALANEARAIVRTLVKDRLAEALEATATVQEAMDLLASWTAEALDELTTKAVRKGAKLRMERRGQG